MLDQWWNNAIEKQAFGRVHRIGQTKETYFVKILAKNTIDERLADMQREKSAAIIKAMTKRADGDPLTEEDLVRLIAPDLPHDHPGDRDDSDNSNEDDLEDTQTESEGDMGGPDEPIEDMNDGDAPEEESSEEHAAENGEGGDGFASSEE